MKKLLFGFLLLVLVSCSLPHDVKPKGDASLTKLIELFTQAIEDGNYTTARECVTFSEWKKCNQILLMTLRPDDLPAIQLWRKDHHLDSQADPWKDSSLEANQELRRRFLDAFKGEPLLTEVTANHYQIIFKGPHTQPVDVVRLSKVWLILDLDRDQLPD